MLTYGVLLHASGEIEVLVPGRPNPTSVLNRAMHLCTGEDRFSCVEAASLEEAGEIAQSNRDRGLW